ncbi:hypothetical protein Forpe1208_v009189 [Fusarium oxysporum f. sp. rapae]|uniref:Uncharacterized protein n=1 Tax=Fusarium oxysporum f. sp. rapae TaxID=485398 RepID=A0A8J5NUZ2_FUSOX|nr:hypothetical protein Forpe1208_v009189 [Fusarium oxysporum f. sp. rapae]
MSPSRKVIKPHFHITLKKAIATNKPTIRHRTIPPLVVCCYTPNAITRLATLFQTQGATPSHSKLCTVDDFLPFPMTVSMSSSRQMPGNFKQEHGVHPNLESIASAKLWLGHFSDDHEMTSTSFASRLPTRLGDPASSEGWSRLSVVTSSREYQDFEMRPAQYACRKLDQVRSPKVG